MAGALYLIHLLLGSTTLFSLRFALFYLASMNLVLGLFNLLPAFPMDGGRVLRGVLAGRMGLVRATQLAATLGKVFAVLFFVLSFLTFNFFLMMIAVFVYLGAEAEASQVLAKTVLGELRVTHLLQPAPAPIDASATVEDAVARMLRDRQIALPVNHGDEFRGVLTLDDLEQVAPERRTSVLVQEIVREVPAVAPAANVWDALRLMTETRSPLLPVVDGGRLVGILYHDDVVRGLRLYQLRRQASAPRMVAGERTA